MSGRVIGYLTSMLKLCLKTSQVDVHLVYEGLQLILQGCCDVGTSKQAREPFEGYKCLQQQVLLTHSYDDSNDWLRPCTDMLLTDKAF